MRILVVDDDSTKLKRVLAALMDVPGCNSSQVDSARDSTDAKRYLRQNQYDLMVLDISLPEHADEPPVHEGGIRLLDEVMEREVYFRPREIVGLTAYTEILDSAGQRFSEDLWLVIHYDNTSETWAEQLQRKVRHILLAQRSAPVPTHDCHLCVVCALPDPELAAVLQIGWNWQQFELPNDPTIYHRGSIQKSQHSLEVVAAAGARMGMTSAAVLSMKMIHAFRPRYLAMTGIIAGIKGRASYGDVIIADPSWDWGSGKYQIQDGSQQFAAAPYQLALNSFVRSKFALLSADKTAGENIRTHWRHASGINVAPRILIGPVASGAAVLADPGIAKSIIQQHRKLVGIDMETYGLLAAAEECPLPQPKAFSIKGVSDFADSEKNDAFQEYASYTSAQTLRMFSETYL